MLGIPTIMDELTRLDAEVTELLNSSATHEMSNADFLAQRQSFVVGNAFDMFKSNTTITRATLKALEAERRHTAQ